MLRATHKRNAAAPLHPPIDGVFPRAVQVQPRALVLDTHWLAGDVHRACVDSKRTTLVTAANQQAVRVFCAQHVVDEIVRHHDLWSTEHKSKPIAADVFLRRWYEEYLPLIRVVPDDGIPLQWLSPAERQRVRIAIDAGSRDVPSIKLARILHEGIWCGVFVGGEGWGQLKPPRIGL